METTVQKQQQLSQYELDLAYSRCQRTMAEIDLDTAKLKVLIAHEKRRALVPEIQIKQG